MNSAEASSEQCPLPRSLREHPEALEPGMQWVAISPKVSWQPLPLVGIAVDALGRPNLVLQTENLEDAELAALLDAVATVRREGPPVAGTFLRAQEVRVIVLSSSPRKVMRRRLQVLADAFPLTWWQLEAQSEALVPLLLRYPAVEDSWSHGLPLATTAALQRLLQGAGRLRPPMEWMDAGGTLLLRHDGYSLLALFRPGDQVMALTQEEGQELRPLDQSFVVDHLLDGLMARLVKRENNVPQPA